MISGGSPTPIRSRSPAILVSEAKAPEETPSALPPQLEARIAALEQAPDRSDFDAPSWFWMILFGLVLPLLLWVIGFRA